MEAGREGAAGVILDACDLDRTDDNQSISTILGPLATPSTNPSVLAHRSSRGDWGARDTPGGHWIAALGQQSGSITIFEQE